MATNGTKQDLTGNRLLDVLPAVEQTEVLRGLTIVALPIKRVLFEPEQAVNAVHFPLNGVVSLVTPLQEGAIVEVATVGNEGVVGVPLVSGGSLAVRAISQVPGKALRMDAAAFLEHLEQVDRFRQVVESYTQALFGQISQAAACNRLHSNEERLSRWLLMSHDRVGTDTFPITHEFLAQMLGARRATVTLSAGLLQAAGIIRYHRGRVTILDREQLEAVSCECYSVIKSALERALTSAVR